MKPEIDYTLYLVTDPDLPSAIPLDQAVENAVKGGCTLVQLREKTATSRDFFDCAVKVKQVTDKYRVPLIINDRTDIALAVDAAGVHVGQSDLPVPAARRLVGPDRVVGASASTFAEAREAVEAGADYLGVGAMFATGTKTDAVITPMDELLRIRQAFTIPIVVIGGINLKTIPLFQDSGIEGIAVVSAILGQPDMEQAARTLRNAFKP